MLLQREVGSAYAVLDESAFESLIKLLSVEEAVEVVLKRRRELKSKLCVATAYSKPSSGSGPSSGKSTGWSSPPP